MSDAPEGADDEKVGYCKPPREHRFEKGKSGNYRGRPKKAGPKTVDETLREVLSEIQTVSLKGVERRMSTQEVMIRSVAQKAMKGDFKAVNVLIRLHQQYADSDATVIEPGGLSTEDRAIMERFLESTPPKEQLAAEATEHTDG